MFPVDMVRGRLPLDGMDLSKGLTGAGKYDDAAVTQFRRSGSGFLNRLLR